MLNGMMAGDGGASTTSDAIHAMNWRSTGAWQGAFAGYYLNSLVNQVNYGYYWSSSVSSAASSYKTLFYAATANVDPGTSSSGRYNGLTVRCMV
jgi:hypothetical protein